MTDYSFKAEDGTSIYAAKWETENPKGIIQIFHGMADIINAYMMKKMFDNQTKLL